MKDESPAHRVIAIDGPAASGKSSVARALARRLGFVYINTGAMYRAVTWLVIRSGTNPDDPLAVETILASADLRFGIAETTSPRENSLLINGTDPAPFLCEPEVNASVSRVAAILKVRHELVARQRTYALGNDIVMEGRDIGSAVFPETPFKFYVDASPEVRAQRRALQGQQDDLAARDRIDSSRKASPLLIAPNARVIDSSHLSVDGVVDLIIEELTAKGLGIGK